MTRAYKIEDEKLKIILDKRAELFTKQKEVNEKLVELDKERESLGLKMERLKEKTAVIIDKNKASFELGEFEIITRVFQENGECFAEIADVVEEYKKQLRAKKDEDNINNGNNGQKG
jgi:hypothetical protein